jgi:Ca-activated chloride channel homolog
MSGFRFSKYKLPKKGLNEGFEGLHGIFKQLLLMTSGDVNEALAWLTNLDQKYNLTDGKYGIGDFIEDLKKKGYLEEDEVNGTLSMSSKSELEIRKNALEEIFGELKRSGKGDHRVPRTGKNGELTYDVRDFQYGDSPDQISFTESLRNAQINHGLGELKLNEEDLKVVDKEYQTINSTVLMIDISHSMILYGEDRITPAKKVALALSELISTRYPQDTLDIIVFGNDAWQIQIKDLPYLQVGPYHTNTVAGLELAMNILRRRKTNNKQIFMITDGKPTCIKLGIKYYKNSFGLDPKIMNKTFNLAAQCRKLKIPVTTFMIASDPYLKSFVEEFTQINQGKAYYSSLKGLGHLVYKDFKKNRSKKF